MLRRSGVRFEIRSTPEQRHLFAMFVGLSRLAYNWILERWQEYYRTQVFPGTVRTESVWNLSSVDLTKE